jgi:hypothetical protein
MAEAAILLRDGDTIAWAGEALDDPMLLAFPEADVLLRVACMMSPIFIPFRPFCGTTCTIPVITLRAKLGFPRK